MYLYNITTKVLETHTQALPPMTKKHTNIKQLLLIPLLPFLTAFGPTSSGGYLCLDMPEIDKSELKRIKAFTQAATTELKSRRFTAFKKRLAAASPLQPNAQDLKDIISNTTAQLKTSPSQSITTIKLLEISGEADFRTAQCGSADPNDNGYLEVQVARGRGRVAYVFEEINTKPLNYTLSYMIDLSDREMQILTFSTKVTAYNDKPAEHYSNIALQAEVNNEFISAGFARSFARDLAEVSSFARTRQLDADGVQFKELDTNEPDPYIYKKLIVNGREYSIFQLGVTSTTDSMTPHISYVSHTNLKQDQVTSEAAAILNHLVNAEPTLAKEFDKVLFVAYAQLPLDKTSNIRHIEVPLNTASK